MRLRCALAASALLAAGLAAKADSITYSYTGGLQYFTATTSGAYDIVAYGASGGSDSTLIDDGSNGAEIGGVFSLTAGETLTLLVGGQGISYTGGDFGTGGGGGGTFVVVSSGDQPLVVAGGGGGEGLNQGESGGNTGTAGGSGFQGGGTLVGGAGGTNGSGGAAGTALGDTYAGGGGGFYGNGGGGSAGGQSFLNGGAGGAGIDIQGFGDGAAGGYGGGGGGSQAAGGAGGGYSGGGGDGGGGGSYLDASVSATGSVKIGSENTGNGQVVITEETAPAVTPEPSTLVLFGTGLLGVAGLVRKRLS